MKQKAHDTLIPSEMHNDDRNMTNITKSTYIRFVPCRLCFHSVFIFRELPSHWSSFKQQFKAEPIPRRPLGYAGKQVANTQMTSGGDK